MAAAGMGAEDEDDGDSLDSDSDDLLIGGADEEVVLRTLSFSDPVPEWTWKPTNLHYRVIY